MTVALPILSACGVETCILPTAMLSTHTGGFWKPAVVHLDETLPEMWQHWRESGIRFDAIYTGYLGSVEAIRCAETVMDELLAPGGVTVVDPAMADHGKLYAGFDKKYAAIMGELCRRADIIIPNITEAAMLAGQPYREVLTEDYVGGILEGLSHKCVVLTGVGYAEGETGIILREDGQQQYYQHRRIGRNYHGTGDIFASCFTGALMQEKTKFESVKIAADFTCKCIENTYKDPAHWYGVKFETALPELIRMLQN